jgi:hypothetical protein
MCTFSTVYATPEHRVTRAVCHSLGETEDVPAGLTMQNAVLCRYTEG